MKQKPHQLRPATAALFAALVFPTAPVFAQDTATVPPPVISAPPPVVVAPPPVTATPAPAPAPEARVTPPPAPAPAPRTTTRTTRSTATRTVTRAPVRAAAPAPRAATAPAPAPAPAPLAQAPVETLPPPAVVETLPPVAPVETVTTTETTTTGSMLPWLLGGLALLAVLAGFFLFRRRRPDAVYEETRYEPAPPRTVAPEPPFDAPIAVAPAAAAPVFVPRADPVPERRAVAEPVADDVVAIPPPEEINVAEADHADVEALAASSEPVAGRPWLEFLMRPMRAGTNRDNTIVQFELTVGNTGDVPARDVRISTWVVAAGEGTDMERSLIAPPADATTQSVNIDAGEGATVEAKIGLAKDGVDDSVLPVVHADARYTLPDGSEGHTHASFAVGVPDSESGELQPFLTDRSSGLRENVEARLYGEPERV